MVVEKISIIEPVGGHGGMDFYDYGLAEGLAQNGIEVTLHTCNETTVRSHKGVKTIKSFGDIWKQRKLRKFGAFRQGYKQAFEQSKREGVSVVHFHFFQVNTLNLMILRMARRYPFKKVVTLHDVDPLVNTASSRLHRLTYALVDHVIVHNNFSKSELKQKEIEPEKITIVPHGNYLPFVETIPQKEVQDNTLSLLFFGQIKDVKGLDILLEALSIAIKTNPNIQLTIAGRPWKTSEKKYNAIIQNLGLNAHVATHLNYIPNEKVIDYFENCDLVVLPYKRIYQSGVLLLSMSYGKPCLTSNLEPFLEIIQDGKNGFLFETESAQNLSGKLLEIANKKDKLNDISFAASALLKEKYDWKIIGEQTKNVYAALLKQNP